MSYKRQTPARDGGRQRFSTQVQSSANIANPATAQAIQPCWTDVESFTGEQYDEFFEDGLTAAINELITFASTCRDRPDAIMIRPSETIAALSNVLAGFIAMDPAAGPHQIRKGVDRIAAHLRTLALEMAGEPRALMLPATQGDGWLS